MRPLVSRSALRVLFLIVGIVLCQSFLWAQRDSTVRARYTKSEYMITMRDDVKLFTSVYTPNDKSQQYPIMLTRTPYSVGPYGPDRYKTSLGPSDYFEKEGYIFVYQDVRGKYRSEGTFEFMRHHIENKKSSADTDESSDTYDTIDWLVKNIFNNNGKVGVWGISYPGYQAAMAAIDAHPALKAVSPQAPMADVFVGDDFHHNGAFFLAHAFRWLAGTAPARSNQAATTSRRSGGFVYGTPDGYEFFMNMGPLSNANAVYFKDQVPVWNEFMEHGTYDEYWQSRNVVPHLKNIKPAIMTVGGWFDAEDKYGAAHVYHQIEQSSPNTNNILVFGPWHHGGWARVDGDTLGHIRFDVKTSLWYREHVELPFFNFYLKNKGEMKLSEATAFMTGANEWKSFDHWPPKEATAKNLYFHANGKLSFTPPAATENGFDSYVSDPAKPVPFTAQTTTSMGHIYMVEDQRFASTRPDVLVYQTDVLTEDVSIAGPMNVSLFASTSGTDCDWVVKLIDVYPGDAPDNAPNPADVRMGGFQMMLVGDVMRSKFRTSFEKPEAMVPDKVTPIEFGLADKLHRFKKGHKIMVQVQSMWFPLVDRNPGKFMDIYRATPSDFQKTTQRLYRSSVFSSHLKLNILQ